MKSCFKKLLWCICVLLLFNSEIFAAIGQSAIITLSFPFGARSTGLGETFTGIADNVDATFYNPAGLGQAPLAYTWKAHFPLPDIGLTTIVAKHKRTFGKRERIWVGTNNKGLVLFNGKVWTTYETYLIEEDEDLIDIAEKFLNVDDKNLMDKAVKLLREKNKIGTNRSHFIKEVISPNLLDSIRNSKNSAPVIENIITSIINLDPSDQNATRIYGIIAAKVDSLKADSISDELVKVFELRDVKFSELVELKIPFCIAIQDTITALALDASGRLWVGTKSGLWRYNGTTWNNYTILDGLPSNTITGIAVGSGNNIAIGTDRGIGLFSDGEWSSYGIEEQLPDTFITSITYGENDVLYAGTASGLVKIADSSLTVYDTSDGLLSGEVFALFFDSENKLWIGSKGGVTIYDEVSWKRYQFPGSEAYCLAEYKPGIMWIGTNKGAISYHAGRIKTDKSGKKTQAPPKWKHFHSKNALEGNCINDITIHGKDIWLITEKAVNQYECGDMEITLFYEPLLPAFDIPELWHATLAGIYPTEEWGTIGGYINYLNFGESEIYDAYGRKTGVISSFEFVAALSYGLQLKEDFSFGLNIKYAHSALAPGIGEGDEGIGRTFAIDAAILKRNLFVKNLNLGFSILNMGPPVFYISKDEADPIPFTLRLGLAYTIVQTPVISLMAALDIDREIVYNEPYEDPSPFWVALIKGLNDEPMRQELEEIISHWGIEFWYAYFVALRMGVMIDEAGSRRELCIGLGLRYGNFSIDWSYIHSPRWSQARDGQWRFSFIFAR